MYPAASAAYPKSIGFWQAMLMIQAFSSSVISAFLPRPGEFQEKKKEQEAAKPDPDADYVDDDEDYGYDPELRYRDSYPRIRKKVVRCKTDSFLTCQTWNLCQA